MSQNGPSPETSHPGQSQPTDRVSPVALPAGVTPETTTNANSVHYTDLQSAARFPIELPVVVKSKSGESLTQTQNISSNGVLFRVDAEMPIGALVDFTISLPAEVVGVKANVQLDCRGRVVRSYENDGNRGVGVVIDEYRFERR